MMFKRKRIVMLPTEEKAIIGQICINSMQMFMWTQMHINQDVTNTLNEYKRINTQHLYILSDEEVEEGDGITYAEAKQILQIKTHHSDFGLKIIASTDPLLNLPQPSQAFIEKYIAKYNKGNKIEEALIEYCNYWEDYKGRITEDETKQVYRQFGPKINLKDNTITIKKIKDTWNREEVESLLHDVLSLGMEIRQNQLNGYCNKSDNEYLKEFIKENL